MIAKTIAVVGGGASGTVVAAHLLRHPSAQPRRVVVLEPAAALGAGVAYGTASQSHLLNVRALGMSALVDDPSDFLAWARRQGHAVTGPEFLPRAWYAAYLHDLLADARAGAPAAVHLEHRRARAVEIRPGGAGPTAITLDDGSTLAADDVLLATGHQRVTPSWVLRHPCVVADPWQPGAVDALSGAGSVLIVGSGLTAIDVVLSLRDRGFAGQVRMVSRNGYLPEVHRESVLPPRPPAARPGDPASRSARGLIRAIREDAWSAGDWRQTIDGLRPQTVGLWQGLPRVEQERALRHAGRQWEVRRHRMAPQIAVTIEELRAADRLTVDRGRVVRMEPHGTGLRTTLAHGPDQRTVTSDAAVVCVGPSADPLHDPLLSRLITDGTIARHPLGMGLDVAPDGRVRSPDGRPWPGLWAVGPLRKGAEWESTAMPEIRLHARDLARSILGAP